MHVYIAVHCDDVGDQTGLQESLKSVMCSVNSISDSYYFIIALGSLISYCLYGSKANGINCFSNLYNYKDSNYQYQNYKSRRNSQNV